MSFDPAFFLEEILTFYKFTLKFQLPGSKEIVPAKQTT